MPCPMAWTSQTPRVLLEMHARRVLSVSTKSHPAPRRVSTVVLENTPTSSLSPLAATVSQEHTRTRSLPRPASHAQQASTRKSLVPWDAHSARKIRFLYWALTPRQHVSAIRAITRIHAVTFLRWIAANITPTQDGVIRMHFNHALVAVVRVLELEIPANRRAFASDAVRASTTTQMMRGRA